MRRASTSRSHTVRGREPHRACPTVPVEPARRKRLNARARPRRAHADRGLPRRGLSLRALCGEPRSRRCRRKPLPHDRGTAADAASGRWVSCPCRALYHVGPERRRTARDQRSDAGHDRPVGSVLIAPYYGHGSGESCSSPELPLPTVTTKARFGLVVPVTRSNVGRAPRSTDDPLPTLTAARGGEFAVVIPVTHADGGNRARTVDDPLPTVTGAHRGELACIPAFARTAAWGERPGQAPRVRSVDEPTPTICAAGRIQLAVAEPVTNGRTYDIRFPNARAKGIGPRNGLLGCGDGIRIRRQ
jgi:hypothetical protein